MSSPAAKEAGREPSRPFPLGSSAAAKETEQQQPPPPFPLARLHIDMLSECASHLDPASLLSFAAVARPFAAAADPVLRERCRARGWALARKPRGAEALAAAASSHASWRALYRRRICGACSGEPGEFQAFEKRGGGSGDAATKLRYLLCKKCVRSQPEVARRLAALELRLDLVGLSGRRLLSEAEERSAFGGGRGGGGRGRRRGSGGRGRGRGVR